MMFCKGNKGENVTWAEITAHSVSGLGQFQ